MTIIILLTEEMEGKVTWGGVQVGRRALSMFEKATGNIVL